MQIGNETETQHRYDVQHPARHQQGNPSIAIREYTRTVVGKNLDEIKCRPQHWRMRQACAQLVCTQNDEQPGHSGESEQGYRKQVNALRGAHPANESACARVLGDIFFGSRTATANGATARKRAAHRAGHCGSPPTRSSARIGATCQPVPASASQCQPVPARVASSKWI